LDFGLGPLDSGAMSQMFEIFRRDGGRDDGPAGCSGWCGRWVMPLSGGYVGGERVHAGVSGSKSTPNSFGRRSIDAAFIPFSKTSRSLKGRRKCRRSRMVVNAGW